MKTELLDGQSKVLGMLYVLENAILNRDFSLDDDDAREALHSQLDAIRRLLVDAWVVNQPPV